MILYAIEKSSIFSSIWIVLAYFRESQIFNISLDWDPMYLCWLIYNTDIVCKTKKIELFVLENSKSSLMHSFEHLA